MENDNINQYYTNNLNSNNLNAQNLHFHPSQISYNEPRQIELLEKCLNKNMTGQEMHEFALSLLHLYMLTHATMEDLPTPRLDTDPISAEGWGYYDDVRNIVYCPLNMHINKDTHQIEPDSIVEIVNTIGHECTHYKQVSLAKFILSLSSEAQKPLIDEELKLYLHLTSFDSLEEEDIAQFYNIVAPYKPIPSSYESVKEFVENIATVTYLDVDFERDARFWGAHFVKEVLNIWATSHYSSPKIKDWAKNSMQYYDKFLKDTKISDEDIASNQQYAKELFKASNRIVTNFAKAIENSLDNEINREACLKTLKYLVDKKNYEDKIKLLECAVYNNLTYLEMTIVNALETDPQFRLRKNELDGELTRWFKTGLINPKASGQTLIYDSYNSLISSNLCKFISPSNYVDIISSLCESGKLNYVLPLCSQLDNLNIEPASKDLIYRKVCKLINNFARNLDSNSPDFLGDLYLQDYSNFYSSFSQFYDKHQNLTKPNILDIDWKKISTLKRNKQKYIEVYGKRQAEQELSIKREQFAMQVRRDLKKGKSKEEILSSAKPQWRKMAEKIIDEFYEENLTQFDLPTDIQQEYKELTSPSFNPASELDFKTLLIKYAKFNQQVLSSNSPITPAKLEKVKLITSTKLNQRESYLIQNTSNKIYSSETQHAKTLLEKLKKGADNDLLDEIMLNEFALVELFKIVVEGNLTKGDNLFVLTPEQVSRLSKLSVRLGKRMQSYIISFKDEDSDSSKI